MENATHVSNVTTQEKQLEEIKKIVGDDVFNLQAIYEAYGKYTNGGINCWECLKRHGYTKKKAAEELLISEAAVRSWAKGRRNPGLENVMQIAKLTGEDIMTLLK